MSPVRGDGNEILVAMSEAEGVEASAAGNVPAARDRGKRENSVSLPGAALDLPSARRASCVRREAAAAGE